MVSQKVFMKALKAFAFIKAFEASQRSLKIEIQVKGAVTQIEKALISDCLRVSKLSWKFRIPTNSNFAIIYPWKLLFY